MRTLSLFIFILLSCSQPSFSAAVHSHDHGDGIAHQHEEMMVDPSTISVETGQAVVQVKGIVCSFCSYGTEKNLSKLDFVDASQFGGNGILTDIKTGQTTIAIKEGEALDFKAIHDAVTRGGYEPISVHFLLAGSIEKDDGGMVIRDAFTRSYRITGRHALREMDARDFSHQVHVHGEDIPSFHPEQAIPVMLDKGGA